MDEKTTYWASVILGALALMLLVVNICMINGNHRLQDEINQRQGAINSGVTLSQINKGLVQALADIAVKSNDSDARGLLAKQGITITAPAKSDEAKEKDASKDSKKKSSDQ